MGSSPGYGRRGRRSTRNRRRTRCRETRPRGRNHAEQQPDRLKQGTCSQQLKPHRALRAPTAARRHGGIRALPPRRAGARSPAPGGSRRQARSRRRRRHPRRSRPPSAPRPGPTRLPRSAAGSFTRRPPTVETKTSEAPSAMWHLRSSTASRRASRPPAMPWATRLGAPELGGPTSPWTSMRSGLRPSITGTAMLPGTPRRRSPSNRALGSRRPCSPDLGHLEQTELARRPVAVLRSRQQPECVVAVAVERQHGVDEVLERPRSGEPAVLGDVPDEQRRDAERLRVAHEPAGTLAHLARRAGLGAARRRQRPPGSSRRRGSTARAGRRR